MVVHKERINERKKIIYFCRMIVCKRKIYINEDPNFWWNGRALKKKINERGPYNLVELLCANNKINQCGP